MSHVLDEIASQPAMWRLAADVARRESRRLPAAGERAAIVGCGTSAVALAEARGLDPDHPRHLTRSVILEPEGVGRTGDGGDQSAAGPGVPS